MLIIKELIFNIFYFGDGVVALEGTDFLHFLLCDGVVVLKELIFNSFYFMMVWWS